MARSMWVCGDELDCHDEECGDLGGYCRPCGPMGRAICIPRCDADNPCVVGETCLADGSCFPSPCFDDIDCPANHECIESRAGASCARRSCLDDSDCAGPCLNGVCYEVQPSCFTCY